MFMVFDVTNLRFCCQITYTSIVTIYNVLLFSCMSDKKLHNVCQSNICSVPNIVFSYLPLYCFQASVITKARTQCYTPCSNAVYKPGQCCPSCEGKFANHHNLQGRCQNAEKVTHIWTSGSSKGSLQLRPFSNGNFS